MCAAYTAAKRENVPKNASFRGGAIRKAVAYNFNPTLSLSYPAYPTYILYIKPGFARALPAK